jgi:hypothetical protein
MQKLLTILSLFLLVGCNSFDLDEKWHPLEKIVERPNVVYGYSGFSTTVGTNVYKSDLDAFWEKNPPGTLRFDALMYHEQVHSKRQLKVGLYDWLALYLYDKKFMWAEEQLGWYTTIQFYRQRGMQVYPPAIASSLSKYGNLSGRMVTLEDALNWVNSVLTGQWKPAEEDKWSLPEFAR